MIQRLDSGVEPVRGLVAQAAESRASETGPMTAIGLVRDARHRYSWNGGPWYPSVTTILGVKDKPALVGWAKRGDRRLRGAQPRRARAHGAERRRRGGDRVAKADPRLPARRLGRPRDGGPRGRRGDCPRRACGARGQPPALRRRLPARLPRGLRAPLPGRRGNGLLSPLRVRRDGQRVRRDRRRDLAPRLQDRRRGVRGVPRSSWPASPELSSSASPAIRPGIRCRAQGASASSISGPRGRACYQSSSIGRR